MQGIAEERLGLRTEGFRLGRRQIEEAVLHRPQPTQAIGGDDAPTPHMVGQIRARAVEEIAAEEDRIPWRHQGQGEGIGSCTARSRGQRWLPGETRVAPVSAVKGVNASNSKP